MNSNTQQPLWNKTRDIRYYRRANTLAVFAVILFGGFRSFAYIEQGHYREMTKMLIFVSIAILLLFLIFRAAGNTRSLALLVPLFVFAAYTAGSVAIGSFRHYFIVYLTLCVLAGVYFQLQSLLRFLIITNITILCMLITGVFLREGTGITGRGELLSDWIMAVCGSVFVYMITNFALNKTSSSAKAEDIFTTLMATTPNLIAMVDERNCITYISRPLVEFAHIKNPALPVGQPILDLFDEIPIKMMITEILESHGPYENTKEIIHDGKSRHFKIVSDKLSGEARGTFIDISDITSVVQSKLEAEEASRSKSAFLATMSHEIRTPLNAIIGLSEIEIQKKLPPDTHEDLEKIYNSGSGLLGIINDILDISKIEAGSFELIPVEYDTPSLINDTIQLNIVRIGSKPINFELDPDETLPSRFRGDELRVKQILNNILSNAFKYTQEGKVSLQIRWEAIEKDAMLCFTVADTGRGIRKEDMGKLFGEYSQLDTKANRKIEGTGLGLSITKKLTEMMDGTITVESEYGKGSVFTVRLRQQIADKKPIGKLMVENLKAFHFRNDKRSRGKNLIRSYMPYGRVLVVDDVETNLDVARGLLLPYGLTIDCASGGREAITKIREEQMRYDVVFMDHMMPEMDGIEAVRFIRNEIDSEYAKNVPIIALTANAIVGNEEMFLSNGFNAFISKPIDIMRLDTILNQWIRDKQTQDILQQAEQLRAEMSLAEAELEAILLDTYGTGGIDFEAGIDRYGNEAAYMMVLRSYLKHTPGLLAKLRSLSRKTLPDYAITVHGLKGSSYGICANEIGRQAEQLEYAAKAGDYDTVSGENETFIGKVESLLVELAALPENAAGSGSPKPRAPSPDKALLEKLLDASKRFKPVIMEEVMSELEGYEYESGSGLVVWLREQLDNLEYDLIRERLEAAGEPGS
ncbi:MAG: response regulator [Spirochaetaceae bacterium]|jgi:signal transduction histidine kinase/AmiR/NasT family two-component response regulator|nr:response regulator [Spirochaetaceae bacterium]